MTFTYGWQAVARGACVAGMLFVVAGCGMEQRSKGDFIVQVGDAVPEFSLKDVDGNIVSSRELKGKSYVIAVFATWCPPCKMELSALEKDVWQPLKDKGIGVIGVDFGDETADQIRTFAAENGFSFPMLVDNDGSFRKAAGIEMVPQSIVVGADGKIIDLHVGFTDEAITATAKELTGALKGS